MNLKRFFYLGFLMMSFFFFQAVQAQVLTQTIRGTVSDRVGQYPLTGATVVLLNSDPLQGTITDIDGNFILEKVPVGKHSLQISMLGYETVTLDNLNLTSGKELVIQVQMEEKAFVGNEATVTAKTDKRKPQNDMLSVSSRTFSVEETQKFAAAVNDPLRMSLSYAGVVSTEDGNNNISIRGNAPGGLLWRMEGIDIPSPNHFTSPGASGGGISILSSQLLANSDFSTGAFGAEYGNALAGVFDLSLRKGNNQKREYTFRAGVLGIDVAAEGPFKKDYAGSYLVNYRYSTLGILSQIGVPIGDGVTTFQDLSYHVFLPTKKAGSFALFGFGGLSSQLFEADYDTALWSKGGDRYDSRFFSNTGAFGLKHTYHFNTNHHLKSAVVISSNVVGYKEEKLDYELVPRFNYQDEVGQNRQSFSTTLNSKFNSRSSLRSGLILNRIAFNTNQVFHVDSLNRKVTMMENDGSTFMYQAFSQWKYKLGSRLTLQSGLHFIGLALNNSYSVEPRASMHYALNCSNSITLGYGLHSQVQPISIYFSRISDAQGNTTEVNKELGLSKAHHLVLAYDRNIGKYWRARLETYYQYLYNIPVSTDPSYQYSVLNNREGTTDLALTNSGKGENFGVEVTLERFLHNDFYFLFSGSVYESRYMAVDGKWHDTRFNTNRQVSVTLGKEYTLKGRKSRVFGWNFKALYSGGMRNVPILLEESIQAKRGVYDYQNAFALQNPDYFRFDVGVSLKRNYQRSAGTLSLDIQNASNRANVGGTYFDSRSLNVKTWTQAPLIPVLAYKLEF
ncbi:MAG: TonB-dependent receptor [Bacteroidota bacterium]|nr:TonB-dependent receptor [Bacteroidota bacterium]MDX5430862.1 TonB-dependent receptor [Bacteroidota bacterium]MDX5469606.1 TonB-dependent receptor [Bacteroidota bacterium]